MAKNLMASLLKLDGIVNHDYDPYLTGVRTSSPSLNFTFGNTHVLPFGYSLVLFGKPKGGKSLITNDMIGQLHKDYPTAVAIKFNTEFREGGQLTPRQMETFGIDKNRYICYEVNQPNQIFDRIEKDIDAACQEGLDVKLIIIDSVNGIQGRRAGNAKSIDVQQIGDHALTIGDGLKRILPVIRKNKIALVMTTQVRAELDPIEIMKHNKYKMAAAFALQHYCEYFMYVEADTTKDGRSDLTGQEFKDENLKDLRKRAEQTGHKIKITMKDSSMGPKGRNGAFTFDYKNGVINTYEEIFLLATNRGIIEKPTLQSYTYKDKKWVGKQGVLDALKTDDEFREEILKEIRSLDV